MTVDPTSSAEPPTGVDVADFDYELPEDRIAQYAIEPRDAARMLVTDRMGAEPEHRKVSDLPGLLAPGDLLVFNRTRVIPARLRATKDTGGALEVLLVHPLERVTDGGPRWRCMIRGKVRPGLEVTIADRTCRIEAVHPDGGRDLAFPADCDVLELADQHGEVPLPPYIARAGETLDRERYQTVFGDRPGSVAAPTAALHITTGLLADLERRGVERAFVDLAVGPGTFKPVQCERVADHQMHAERCECPPETVRAIQACRERGGRVIAVGTTVVRTLETAAASGRLAPYAGWTSIFLHPPHRPRVVDGLMTNFHLPRSTLLMLVACFIGIEHLHRCYRAAIEDGYRFYSYGDAMLIMPGRKSQPRLTATHE